jgi:hypothetical protein
LTKSAVALSTLTLAATVATPTFATTTTPTWTQGQVVTFSAYSLLSQPATFSIVFSNNNGQNFTAKATIVPNTEQNNFVFKFADYTLTVPDLGSSDSIFNIYEMKAGSLITNLSANPTFSSSPQSLSTINYVPIKAGLLPEFPYAGAVPLVGLGSVGAIAFYVRQRKSAKA